MVEGNKVNREYKDSVFRMYFNDEEKLKSLYSSIKGVPPETFEIIEIRTLDEAIYGDIKNDLAILADNKIFVFMEHMSSFPVNLPIRMLEYCAESYKRILSTRKINSSANVKMPAPEFYVLYNGKRKLPGGKGVMIARLSDSFIETPDPDATAELCVKVIDINDMENNELLNRCSYLKEYSILIAKIREYEGIGMELNSAVSEAVEYCILNGVMVDFLKRYGKEARKVIYEYVSVDERIEEEKAISHNEGRAEGREEGREEGRKQGIEQGRAEAVINLMRNAGLELEKALDMLGIEGDERDSLMDLVRKMEG